VKPLVVFPDAERVVVDYLTKALADRSEDVTVGVGVPSSWTSSQKRHVQVAWDGTPSLTYPAAARATVRVTAWSSSTTASKDLAGLCQALLLTHPGGGGVGNVREGTGVLPAQDPDTKAQLASITVRVSLRGALI